MEKSILFPSFVVKSIYGTAEVSDLWEFPSRQRLFSLKPQQNAGYIGSNLRFDKYRPVKPEGP